MISTTKLLEEWLVKYEGNLPDKTGKALVELVKLFLVKDEDNLK